ncbi:CECR2 histone acetyl-lysine reader dikar isoform X2 [Lycorma delicatula]|uniref:CECR2 histone acetyl-lysine reader dikar isoform X2 n=1 Tax=Lycorma delicatula TaxID=130591 RepID=UPI003F517025
MDDIQSWWEVPSIAHFCSLFRVAFNLLDFDIEELEEALLTDGTEDSGSSLLQELIVRLLCGCLGNNGISTFNYQMFLRRLFRQKCREYGMENPFDSDIDFQFLPLRTKVEILHALCDFRLDADDVLDVLKNLDSDSLRVHPLGYDENRSAYWYFYGTRLYREDYPRAKRKKKKGHDREKLRNKKKRNKKEDEDSSASCSDIDENKEFEMGIGEWQVVCYTESDWERLALKMEDSHSKEERALHTVLAEDFLPEIPRLFEEKERLHRKRLMEMQPRRQSSRLEKLKHQKEEERQRQARQERLERQRVEAEKDSEKKEREKENRATRAMMRSRSSSECDSSIGGNSSAVESTDKPKGRQTNNSLSSATGQIIIQPSRQKLRTSQVFRQSVEDLQTGLYKILDRIKNHDDAWPFVDPVEEEYAPRYYSVITHPMDLQRMEDKLDNGEYLTFNDFKADFQLIVDNCRQYNGSDNEYTEMVGKLQEAFEAAVDRYLETEMSTDEEVAVEFPGEQAGSRKKRSSTNTKTASEPRTPSDSIAQRSGESENENEDLDADNERNTLREDSSEPDLSQDSDVLVRKTNSKKTSSGRSVKKSGVTKDPDALEALELATEQTLKDINKWLDDTPRFSEFSSASNSPSQIVVGDECEMNNRIDTEYRHRLKLERSHRPRERVEMLIASQGPSFSTNNYTRHCVQSLNNYFKDPHRRRLMKDQTFLKRRREIHRTIDRLQPGKSKGNLLSNLSVTKNGEETCPTNKDTKSSVADKVDESTPKLSLGTVLTNDVIGFGKHNFGENDVSSIIRKDVDSADCSDSKPLAIDEEEKKSPQEEVRLEDSCEAPPEKKIKVEDEPLIIDVEKKNTTGEIGSNKQEKSTPNFTAWFKAFGAPKSQPATKKKTELATSEECKESPKNIEPIKYSKEEDTIEDDKDKKLNVVVPPLQSPAKRQRKASTGSSVSERSSFSQDPMDQLIDGSSPRPSLDEPYLSPQSEPVKTPYHHSPINGTIRVGFYQDTSFPRSNSSSSPRDPPSCSPREPQSCSPRELPNCSPRDLPNCSPREPMPSPKSDYHPTYPPVTIPNYSSPAVTSSPASSLYEAPLSPYPAHMPYYDTSKSLTEQYRTQQPAVPAHAHVEKPLSSVFPVKKRIYNDVENTQAVKGTQDLSSTYRGGSFTPTRGAVEQDRGFTPTPGRMPTQPSPATRHTFTPDSGIPMGLTHHPLPPHPLMDPYAEDRLLAQSYFSGDIYAKSAAQVSNSSMPLTMFSQSGTVTTTSSFTKENPSHSPYPARPELTEVNVSSDYSRSNLGTYPDPRPLKSSDSVPSSYTSSGSLSKSKSPSALNYSNRNPEMLSPTHSNETSSPINFSNNDLHSSKVATSSPITYFSRSQDIMQSTKSSCPPLEYSKLNSELLTSKVSAPSPISYASNRTMVDMLPGKVNSSYSRTVSDLSTSAGINYTTTPDLVSNKINVPSPLSYSTQSDILSGKVNYNHPMSDLMQSQSRYNYAVSDIIQSKGYPVPELMQTKSNAPSYVGRPVELLSPNVYNYPPVSRSTPTSKQSDLPLKVATKKPNKKSKKQNLETGFQQYSSPEAISLKTASVVPGSAFNFGPAAPLKDTYASYLEDMRSSGYYVPHPEPPNSSNKSSSPTPHPSATPFPFLGPSSRPSAYPPHPFMNSPYQQYLQRHPEELLRPMVLHQSLLPAAGYPPPGYLSMHDAITRPPWL